MLLVALRMLLAMFECLEFMDDMLLCPLAAFDSVDCTPLGLLLDNVDCMLLWPALLIIDMTLAALLAPLPLRIPESNVEPNLELLWPLALLRVLPKREALEMFECILLDLRPEVELTWLPALETTDEAAETLPRSSPGPAKISDVCDW